MNTSGTGRAGSRTGPDRQSAQRRLVWPGDPATGAGAGLTAEDVDFEALALVLANTCRWGGRTRRFWSVAQRAVVASEAVEALAGPAPEERRTLALEALLAGARVAWAGAQDTAGPASAKAVARAKRDGAAIDRAVREAAGLEGEPTSEQADLLRFVARMTDAAERRDFPDAGIDPAAGVAFPPLKRRLRPVGPDRAAQLWLKRWRELTGRPAGAEPPAGANPNPSTPLAEQEDCDVAHLAKNPPE